MNTYALPPTGILFRCITTLRCSKTCEMFQAGIETRMTFCQSDILSLSFDQSQLSVVFFFKYIFTCTLTYIYILVAKNSITKNLALTTENMATVYHCQNMNANKR